MKDASKSGDKSKEEEDEKEWLMRIERSAMKGRNHSQSHFNKQFTFKRLPKRGQHRKQDSMRTESNFDENDAMPKHSLEQLVHEDSAVKLAASIDPLTLQMEAEKLKRNHIIAFNPIFNKF